jgi:hypothetical protein
MGVRAGRQTGRCCSLRSKREGPQRCPREALFSNAEFPQEEELMTRERADRDQSGGANLASTPVRQLLSSRMEGALRIRYGVPRTPENGCRCVGNLSVGTGCTTFARSTSRYRSTGFQGSPETNRKTETTLRRGRLDLPTKPGTLANRAKPRQHHRYPNRQTRQGGLPWQDAWVFQ